MTRPSRISRHRRHQSTMISTFRPHLRRSEHQRLDNWNCAASFEIAAQPIMNGYGTEHNKDHMRYMVLSGLQDCSHSCGRLTRTFMVFTGTWAQHAQCSIHIYRNKRTTCKFTSASYYDVFTHPVTPASSCVSALRLEVAALGMHHGTRLAQHQAWSSQGLVGAANPVTCHHDDGVLDTSMTGYTEQIDSVPSTDHDGTFTCILRLTSCHTIVTHPCVLRLLLPRPKGCNSQLQHSCVA
jgi:hypothetical protein